MTERQDLGEASDIDFVRRLLPIAGATLVDIGCGPGIVARELVGLGATVLGVEPDPIQAQKNREAEPTPGLTLVEGGAERLPLADDSVDGVFFFRSLHHVPIELMEAALVEAARVLKSRTGFLCVVEPGMTGTHFQVMKPFHDETRVRTAAQAVLDRVPGRLFEVAEFFRYVQYPRYPAFEAMVARVTGQTFNNISRERVETDEVRALFERGRTAEGDYVFEQPMLVNLYRAPH